MVSAPAPVLEYPCKVGSLTIILRMMGYSVFKHNKFLKSKGVTK
jgi:hypothetical protein